MLWMSFSTLRWNWDQESWKNISLMFWGVASRGEIGDEYDEILERGETTQDTTHREKLFERVHFNPHESDYPWFSVFTSPLLPLAPFSTPPNLAILCDTFSFGFTFRKQKQTKYFLLSFSYLPAHNGHFQVFTILKSIFSRSLYVFEAKKIGTQKKKQRESGKTFSFHPRNWSGKN